MNSNGAGPGAIHATRRTRRIGSFWRNRGRPVLVPIVVTITCLVALVSALGACGSDVSSSSDVEAFVQAEGEILLEPSGTAGPESFADKVFEVRGPTTTLSIPGPAAKPPQSTLASGQVAVWPGDTPGLYGGSRDKARCDKEAQLQFLEENPDKAGAFCRALNSDPTLHWSGGSQVSPEHLREYFDELTPLVLTRDTRVTNHGFRDGLPTPRQSVLQAGQAVLVDSYGVPRVRCECGNPLIPPQPVRTPSTYTGSQWEGFDPTLVVVIQQTTVIIDIFVVIDIETGEVFERPPGSAGEEDVPRDGATTTSSSTTTSSAGATGESTEGDGDGKSIESSDGTYTGVITWYPNKAGIVREMTESRALVEIRDSVVTGTVEGIFVVENVRSGDDGDITVTERAHLRVTFTGTVDENGTVKGEGTSTAEYEVISVEPQSKSDGVMPTQSRPEGYPITVAATVSDGHLEGELLWDGEARYKFDGSRP